MSPPVRSLSTVEEEHKCMARGEPAIKSKTFIRIVRHMLRHDLNKTSMKLDPSAVKHLQVLLDGRCGASWYFKIVSLML